MAVEGQGREMYSYVEFWKNLGFLVIALMPV
jgi:hypothetical protein